MNNDFLLFLTSTPQTIFIEVEGKDETMLRFIQTYNSKYNESIDMKSIGICKLGRDVDKWGVELRIYFNDIVGIPSYWNDRKYNNIKYRSDEFKYRLDDNGLALCLFENGYRLGYNC